MCSEPMEANTHGLHPHTQTLNDHEYCELLFSLLLLFFNFFCTLYVATALMMYILQVALVFLVIILIPWTTGNMTMTLLYPVHERDQRAAV